MISEQRLAAIYQECLLKGHYRPPDGPLEEHIGEIRAIIQRNVASGRFQHVKNYRGGHLTVGEYARQVISNYLESYPLVSGLIAEEGRAWQSLWEMLFVAAYHKLCSYGWDREQAWGRAQEVTQEACIQIHGSSYPWDCPFDAWALTILIHIIKRQYKRTTSPLDVPGMTQTPQALRQESLEGEEYGDRGVAKASIEQNGFRAVEDHEMLTVAIRQLPSAAQREVIIALFFEGLSVNEIAVRLGKTPQAIYNLKHRALAKLKALLGPLRE